MLFGRSLFAGALVAGLVSASGAAFCSATISGAAQASFLGKTVGIATAAASADTLRSVTAVAVRAANNAKASGAALALFHPTGLASAVAACTGAPLGSFYGAATAHVTAHVSGTAFRRFRFWALSPAKCVATGEAESYSYVYAYGAVALGKATAFGTTYHVGIGHVNAAASIVGAATRTVGVKQTAIATAHALAAAINTGGGLADGHGRAEAWGDAAVRRDGRRWFECYGDAEAISSILPATTVVFQPQMAVARSILAGVAVQSRGAKSTGAAQAQGFGVGVVGQTAVQGANAGNEAVATGRARRSLFVQASARSAAVVRARPKWRASAKGRAAAIALLTSDVWLLVRAKPGAANAIGRGAPERVVIAVGAAQAFAQATGYNQINDLILAPSTRTLSLSLVEREFVAEPETRLLAA